jgi:hypothetical protein
MECGHDRHLRIEPEGLGFDNRTFECPQCENVISETFKIPLMCVEDRMSAIGP